MDNRADSPNESTETDGDNSLFRQWINSMTEDERRELWQLTEEDECREMEEAENLRLSRSEQSTTVKTSNQK